MKKLIYITLMTAFAFISCNKGEMNDASLVTLNYEVALPVVATKAMTIGDGSHVDEVVCAVFENGREHQALRRTIVRNQNGTFPAYQPSLYLGREYQIVFWAHKSGKYNVSDMADITYGEAGYATNDENMDAFTLTQTIKINSDRKVTVGTGEAAAILEAGQPMTAVLKRPFAKLNIGTVASDWTQDVNVTHSRITLSVVQTHFNAVTGQVVAEKTLENQTYSAPIVPKTFTAEVEVDGVMQTVEYKYISLNYLFPGSVAVVTIEVASKDFDADDFDAESDIVSVVTKPNVPINGNQQTSMVGNVLKGDLKFVVTVDGSMDSTQNNVGY